MNETNDVSGTRAFPTDADIHAYVDGHMGDLDRVRMDAWLIRNPSRAGDIRRWQGDAQALRAAFGDLPAPAVQARFDPMISRARHRHRMHTRLAQAAVLVLTLCVGAMGGWQARRLTSPVPAPMADAVQAYRTFALNRHLDLDVTQREPGQVQAWLVQHFRAAPRLPSLDAAGFHPVGARLLATDSGPAAIVLYRSVQGDAISFYIRPPSPSRSALPRGQRRDGQLVATYWSGNGYNYALVSRDVAPDVRAIREAAFSPST